MTRRAPWQSLSPKAKEVLTVLQDNRAYMKQYMRDYRAGKRRTPSYPVVPSTEEREAVKQVLRSAERLRAVGVKK